MVVPFVLWSWNIIRAGGDPGRGPIGTEQLSPRALQQNEDNLRETRKPINGHSFNSVHILKQKSWSSGMILA